MDIDEKYQIDKYFEGLNVDYSQLQCSLLMAEFIANFIAKYVKKEIPLELITYRSISVRHHLKLVGKDLVLAKFNSFVGKYHIENVSDFDEVILNIPHRDTYFYYISEIIRNIAFFNYLVFEETTYSNVNQFKYSDLSKILNIRAQNNYAFDYGMLNIYDGKIWLKFYRYSLSITIEINKYSTRFYLGNQNFETFNDLIFNINKYLYKSIVESVICVSAADFTFQHRELLKMATI